jgi:hypothetical protein
VDFPDPNFWVKNRKKRKVLFGLSLRPKDKPCLILFWNTKIVPKIQYVCETFILCENSTEGQNIFGGIFLPAKNE